MDGAAKITRHYRPNTLILETRFETADGADSLRHRSVALQPAGDAVVSKLGAITYQRPVNVRT